MRKSMMATCLAFAALATMGASGCDYKPTSSDVQRDRQELVLQEGAAAVGIPAIKNFREMRLLKDIYELRDQDGLVTYTYLWSEMQAKLVFFCDSIGYGIPYATQFTAPQTMQRYYMPASKDRTSVIGSTVLPQADPNGLFSPASADGTWVMCKDPNGKTTRPIFVEPRVVVSPFKMGG